MKHVLVTGSSGFVGKNLVESLKLRDDVVLSTFDVEDDVSALSKVLSEVDFIYHLAGVNRPETTQEFRTGNVDLTERIISSIKQQGRVIPVLLSSSTQAALDNPYGQSKRQAEDVVFAYGKECDVPVLVYRLPNLFGKWCRPNYNSVVATFCHNIAHGLPITVNDPDVVLNLAYIDDVVASFVNALEGKSTVADSFTAVSPVHSIRLGELADVLHGFKSSRSDLAIPDMANPLVKKLYSTYLSYLPTEDFSYPLTMHRDERGSFTEFLKTPERGQVSVNISKPGITKGDHWHHTKNEKFLVVSGTGLIRFRRIDDDEIVEYKVSGEKMEVVDIPPGYTHNISNTGEADMVTIMWANERFDLEQPDTYYEPVAKSGSSV